jgi:hypothetical protein
MHTMCRKATAASFVPKRYTSNSGYSRAGIWASVRADLAYARGELTVQVATQASEGAQLDLSGPGTLLRVCVPDLHSNRHIRVSWSS